MKTLPQPWTVAMEATIFTAWIYDHLEPHAAAVKVAHPLMLRAIAVAKKKNDRSVSVFPFRNRVSSKEAFEGLEPGEGKPSCPVLRGPGGRKAAWLLGSPIEGDVK
jgi:hypothetical protein